VEGDEEEEEYEKEEQEEEQEEEEMWSRQERSNAGHLLNDIMY